MKCREGSDPHMFSDAKYLVYMHEWQVNLKR